LHALTEGLVSALLPDSCHICQLPLVEAARAPLCDECRAAVAAWRPALRCPRCAASFRTPEAAAAGECGDCRRDPPAFDRAEAGGLYAGELRRAVHLFKYGGMTPLADALGGRAAAALAAAGWGGYEALVPTPLHWRRRWQRRFNQADLLARAIGRASGLPVEPLLRRTRATPPQARLAASARHASLRGAFAAADPERVRGRRLIVVDDVMTTGATLDACARALRRAGAASVAALVAARADLEERPI
jgi:ComF family protein